MASAACMMVRTTFFQQLGGFDDRLPLGYEDVEICWRAWVQQRKTLYIPNAICWHRIGGSGGSLEGARFGFRGVLKGRLLLVPNKNSICQPLVRLAAPEPRDVPDQTSRDKRLSTKK